MFFFHALLYFLMQCCRSFTHALWTHGVYGLSWIPLFFSSASTSRLIYSKESLLALRNSSQVSMRHPVPSELMQKCHGCWAGSKLKALLGVRALSQRRYKLSIPSVLMGNVNALNKMDELTGLIRNQSCYREGSFNCPTGVMASQLHAGC